MLTQSADTTPEAEKILIDLIRKSSLSKRMSIVRSISQTVIYLSRRAIKRANPSLSERELDIAFVGYHYGQKLAERLRLYLEQNQLWKKRALTGRTEPREGSFLHGGRGGARRIRKEKASGCRFGRYSHKDGDYLILGPGNNSSWAPHPVPTPGASKSPYRRGTKSVSL